jgi:integrase
MCKEERTNGLNLSTYSREWAETILEMKKPATRASMQSHVRKMDKYLGKYTLDDLTEGLIQKHISMISKELSPRATRNYWGTFRLILSRAKKEGLIQSVPEPVLPRGGAKPQPYLGVEQMRELSRREVLYFVLSEAGLRIGEALGLKPGDIDFKNLTLTVNRSVFNGQEQNPKSSNAYRTISISRRLTERLREAPMGYNFIFETRNRTSRRQTQEIGLLHRCVKSSNFPSSGAWGFHAFRRGNATALSKIGCPVKVISYRHGRSTGNLTVDTYIGYEIGEDRKFADELGEMLSV